VISAPIGALWLSEKPAWFQRDGITLAVVNTAFAFTLLNHADLDCDICCHTVGREYYRQRTHWAYNHRHRTLTVQLRHLPASTALQSKIDK
jgi:hypothetical protein